jgi:hypothetical protein
MAIRNKDKNGRKTKRERRKRGGRTAIKEEDIQRNK